MSALVPERPDWMLKQITEDIEFKELFKIKIKLIKKIKLDILNSSLRVFYGILANGL